ncbi:MAG: hypothetical protein IJ217_04725 [Clostridia bacterium]|nr:hypothetical protein [Clostridia bacterium]
MENEALKYHFEPGRLVDVNNNVVWTDITRYDTMTIDSSNSIEGDPHSIELWLIADVDMDAYTPYRYLQYAIENGKKFEYVNELVIARFEKNRAEFELESTKTYMPVNDLMTLLSAWIEHHRQCMENRVFLNFEDDVNGLSETLKLLSYLLGSPDEFDGTLVGLQNSVDKCELDCIVLPTKSVLREHVGKEWKKVLKVLKTASKRGIKVI